MKIVGSLALLLVLIVVATVVAGQAGLFTGQVPTDLGVHEGRLRPPSSAPNSVSSQADLYPDHPQRAYARIAPISFTGSAEVAMHKLASTVKGTKRCTIFTQQPDYLYVQCSTALLRFTDDVEFWLDRPANVIQLRSASRLGHSDLGVNRARLETIRAQFQKN